MDRQEILNRLMAFPYDRDEYWVITGSAMVMYGIKEHAGDIDLGCSVKMADLLENVYIVIFSPEDLSMIKNGPGKWLTFLNRTGIYMVGQKTETDGSKWENPSKFLSHGCTAPR